MEPDGRNLASNRGIPYNVCDDWLVADVELTRRAGGDVLINSKFSHAVDTPSPHPSFIL